MQFFLQDRDDRSLFPLVLALLGVLGVVLLFALRYGG
jgi:hypothetical protein